MLHKNYTNEQIIKGIKEETPSILQIVRSYVHDRVNKQFATKRLQFKDAIESATYKIFLSHVKETFYTDNKETSWDTYISNLLTNKGNYKNYTNEDIIQGIENSLILNIVIDYVYYVVNINSKKGKIDADSVDSESSRISQIYLKQVKNGKYKSTKDKWYTYVNKIIVNQIKYIKKKKNQETYVDNLPENTDVAESPAPIWWDYIVENKYRVIYDWEITDINNWEEMPVTVKCFKILKLRLGDLSLEELINEPPLQNKKVSFDEIASKLKVPAQSIRRLNGDCLDKMWTELEARAKKDLSIDDDIRQLILDYIKETIESRYVDRVFNQLEAYAKNDSSINEDTKQRIFDYIKENRRKEKLKGRGVDTVLTKLEAYVKNVSSIDEDIRQFILSYINKKKQSK